jgi:hypothetical protein
MKSNARNPSSNGENRADFAKEPASPEITAE